MPQDLGVPGPSPPTQLGTATLCSRCQSIRFGSLFSGNTSEADSDAMLQHLESPGRRSFRSYPGRRRSPPMFTRAELDWTSTNDSGTVVHDLGNIKVSDKLAECPACASLAQVAFPPVGTASFQELRGDLRFHLRLFRLTRPGVAPRKQTVTCGSHVLARGDAR